MALVPVALPRRQSLDAPAPLRSMECDRAIDVSVANSLRAPDGSEWSFEDLGTVCAEKLRAEERKRAGRFRFEVSRAPG